MQNVQIGYVRRNLKWLNINKMSTTILQGLLTKRNKAHEDAKAIHELAQQENRDITPDEQIQFDKAFADMESYDKQLKQQERMANLEDYSGMETEKRIGFGGSEDTSQGGKPEARSHDLVERDYQVAFEKNYFRSSRRVIEDSDFEKHLPKELRVAQVVGTENIGGYLVPEEWANRIIKVMSYYGPMLEAGNLFITSTGRKLNIPTEDTTSQKGAIIAEDTADSIELVNWGTLAYEAYMYTSKIIPISLELLQDNDYDVESRVIMAAGERIGRILNEHFTTGLGPGSDQPEGVVTGSTDSGLGIAANTLTVDMLIDLEHSVDRAYRMGPKVAWMFNDKTLAELKKLSLGNTTAGYPLWVPSLRVGEPDQILGYRYWVNNEMDDMSTITNAPVLFGDFGKYGIRQARGINLRRTTERYWEKRVVAYNAIARFDARVEDADAIKYLTVTS